VAKAKAYLRTKCYLNPAILRAAVLNYLTILNYLRICNSHYIAHVRYMYNAVNICRVCSHIRAMYVNVCELCCVFHICLHMFTYMATMDNIRTLYAMYVVTDVTSRSPMSTVGLSLKLN